MDDVNYRIEQAMAKASREPKYRAYNMEASRQFEAIPVDDLGLYSQMSRLGMVEIRGTTEEEREIIGKNTRALRADTLKDHEKSFGEIHKTHLEICAKDGDMLVKNTAVGDAYDAYMEDMSKRSEVHRFMNIHEMEQIAETGIFTNYDRDRILRGNWEPDTHRTKSFTLTKYHWLQTLNPIRITFRDNTLGLNSLRSNPVASRIKTMKYGQPVAPLALMELELRLPIDEYKPPKIPNKLTVNIPPDADVSEGTLRKLYDRYKVTRDVNFSNPY